MGGTQGQERGAYLGSAGRRSVHGRAREVVGQAEGAQQAVPGGPVSEQRPPPPGQGDSGFRRPGGVGAGRGRPPPRRPIQRAAGERGRERIRDCSARAGPPAQSVPPDAAAPPAHCGPLPLQSFSLLPALTSCKLLAETLPSSGPVPRPMSPRGRAVNMEGPPQNRHSGACCPKTYSSTTSPKVDQSPWDLPLTMKRPPPPTRVSGHHCPT